MLFDLQKLSIRQIFTKFITYDDDSAILRLVANTINKEKGAEIVILELVV